MPSNLLIYAIVTFPLDCVMIDIVKTALLALIDGQKIDGQKIESEMPAPDVIRGCFDAIMEGKVKSNILMQATMSRSKASSNPFLILLIPMMRSWLLSRTLLCCHQFQRVRFGCVRVVAPMNGTTIVFRVDVWIAPSLASGVGILIT